MIILVDSREQLPLWDGETTTRRQKLEVGDYTTLSLHNKAHAERKSGQDLYCSIVQNHQRFARMLTRAREQNIVVAIFVECDEEAFYMKQFKRGYGLKCKTEVLKKIVHTMRTKYEIPFIWCYGRTHMKTEMRKWFEQQELLLEAQHG